MNYYLLSNKKSTWTHTAQLPLAYSGQQPHSSGNGVACRNEQHSLYCTRIPASKIHGKCVLGKAGCWHGEVSLPFASLDFGCERSIRPPYDPAIQVLCLFSSNYLHYLSKAPKYFFWADAGSSLSRTTYILFSSYPYTYIYTTTHPLSTPSSRLSKCAWRQLVPPSLEVVPTYFRACPHYLVLCSFSSLYCLLLFLFLCLCVHGSIH